MMTEINIIVLCCIVDAENVILSKEKLIQSPAVSYFYQLNAQRSLSTVGFWC